MPEAQVIDHNPSDAESAAAFASAFGADGANAPSPEPVLEETTPSSEAQPQPNAPAPVAEQPAKAPARDPLEVVTERLAALDGVVKAVGDLDHRFKSYEGRIGKITASIEQLAAAKAAATTTTADTPTDAQMQAAGDDPEYMKQLAEDFPVWADALNKYRAELRAEIAAIPKGPKDADLLPLIEQHTAAKKAEWRAEAYLDARHDDWEKTLDSETFKGWFMSQGPDIQALAYSNSGPEVSRVLKAFAEAQKKPAAKNANTERLRQAIAPTGVPNAAPAPLTEADAFVAGFNEAH